jgi:hypothetical protein
LLGANVFFLDAIGGNELGDPVMIAHILQDQFAPMTVIEHTIDVYPNAALVSGTLWGGWDWGIDPDLPHTIFGTPTFQKGTFQRFGRYVMDDRILLMGTSNGDHQFWGAATGYDYFRERQAFLLGGKFDIAYIRLAESANQLTTLNVAVAAVLDEWDRVHWWERDCVYRDRDGITNVPVGIDVRRFVDRDGVNLFVVDNWNQYAFSSFQYNGIWVPVPTARLTIIEAPCPGDLDGNGQVDFHDLGQLLQSYGLNDGGDLDRDGDTDFADLGLLLQQYGNDCT